MGARIAGLFVPLLTPLSEGGAVDTPAIAGHVERLLDGGVEGLVALGTTGEFADLLADERAAVVAATVTAAAGRVPVLAGVGAVGAAEACGHARAAASAGADGLLALPPLYWKLDDDALLRHFESVAAATDLPLLLYDFPALAGTALSPALVERAAAMEKIIGIKQSGPELGVTHAVLRRVKAERPDFSVMTGAADLVLPGLLAGTDGTIAAIANVDPGPLARMLAAHRAGDLTVAAACHEDLRTHLPIAALSRPGILALKAAARALGSPIEPVVRTWPADPKRVVAEATALAERLRAAAA